MQQAVINPMTYFHTAFMQRLQLDFDSTAVRLLVEDRLGHNV